MATFTFLNEAYLAYFGRPVDTTGSIFFANKTEAEVQAAFAASNESQALYGTTVDANFINKIYLNVIGREAEPNGITHWLTQISNGTVTQAGAALAILNDAQLTPDATTVNNKLAASKLFADSLDTTAEIIGYSGTTAAASARAFLTSVTATAATQAQVDAAIVTVAAGGDANVGQTFTLTTGVDTLTGGAGNDTFNASVTGTSATLGGLDSIDGGAGTDTVNIADSAVAGTAAFALPTGMVIKNVETLNVTTNGNIGDAGGTAFDVSGFTGLTSFTGVAAGTGVTVTGSNVKAANTTAVTMTATAGAIVKVDGGSVVGVTGGAATSTITGAALTTVTVKNSAGMTIDNTNAAGTTSVGTTLTAVTLSGVDSNTAIKGAGVTTLSLDGVTTAARTVTITNGTANHVLTVNANGTGFKADGTAAQTIVTETTATAIAATVNTSAKSSLDLTGITTVKALTLTGAGALTLKAMGATTTSIDGSTATGALTLGTLDAAAVTVKTGAGNDTFTLSATTKATVDSGAGNDSVTLASALAAGSTINLGAGNDKLLFATGGSVAASTTGNTTVIDGGDGIDSVSANFINAGNAAQFKNFELLNLDSTTGLDLALLTGSTLTGLTMSTASTTATYQNVTKSMGLTVDFVGTNTAVNTLSMTGVTGTADAYSITFAAAAATTAATSASVQAGTIVVAGIENFNVVSGGTNQWNSLTLGADTSANTVTITGATNLDLAFATGFGSTTAPQTGVTLIDGSAATGKLAIITTGVVGATAGLTVKGGSANDAITLAQKATVDAGAGNDTIVVSSFGGTITTGAGTDVVNVKAAATGSVSAPVITTITDFTVGTDKLALADKGAETFTATKVDISTATALFGGTVNALDLAATTDATTNAAIKWFQYAGDTYIVQDLSASTTNFTTTDIVVKLTGLVDLSTLTVASFDFV